MILRSAMRISLAGLLREERGGAALLMLIGFIALAVPLMAASAQTSTQLSRNSLRYANRVTEEYNAVSGVEVAAWEAANNPAHDDGLNIANPSKAMSIDSNEETVNVTTTKIFGSDDLQGQGLLVTKTVNPTSTPPDTATTFTYTITIQNDGTDSVTVDRIRDYLPPRLSYVSGSTSGLTASNPDEDDDAGPTSCGAPPFMLEWDLSPDLQIEVAEKRTLSFDAIGTLSDGAYRNQVRVTYVPWWDPSPVDIYSPYSAEIVVGAGTPTCGYDADLLVTKSVSPTNPAIGVPTEFTYTITMENTSSGDLSIQRIQDLLPPGFTYVAGSSSGVSGADPTDVLDPILDRRILSWGSAGETAALTTISAGATLIQVLKATVTPESGVNYINEVNVSFEPTADVIVDEYADLVLVFDNSISVSDIELADLKIAANTIVDRFKLDKTAGRIRIGATRFAGSSAPLVNMTDVDLHSVDEPLHDGINSLSWFGGLFLGFGTNILDAINGGAAQFSTGLGDRPAVPNLMIIITDGNDNDGNTLQDLAGASAASGVEIFAVGVGSDVSISTLDAIATDPDSDHVFFTDDYADLLSLVDTIVGAALDAAKKVAVSHGGGSPSSSVSAGTLYDVESTALDGTKIRSRVYVAADGTVEVQSWQNY